MKATLPEVQEVLATLVSLDREELVKRWEQAFGCPAPRRCRPPLLYLALGWHCQMQASKGPSTRPAAGLKRSLRQAAQPVLLPGTRLLREWQGQTHQVLVLADGFEYAGTRHRSLTAIARQITGTPWSGPLFFGLRK